MNLVWLLVAIAIPLLLIYPVSSLSQTAAEDGTGVGGVPGGGVPGGIIPEDGKVGPVGSTGAEYKFDDGFHQKIQGLITEEPVEGEYGVYDGTRYYDVLIVVSRDDGDDRNPDETAEENKDAVVKRLELLGARDVISAQSLSFVTASIPVADVPGFSLHDEVYALGDGELPVTVDVDVARQTIRATADALRGAVASVPNGNGVTVAVVDRGINSTHLNDAVTKRAYCNNGPCRDQPGGIIVGLNEAAVTSELDELFSSNYNQILASHGTKVAQVLAASGMTNNSGIAQGVTLLDAMYGRGYESTNFVQSLAHAVDWSYLNGADIVNISVSANDCGSTYTTAFNHILNEAVDKGMVVVKSAGNDGLRNTTPVYHSINNPGCAHNVITVGGINDRGTQLEMYNASSRGPSSNLKPSLLPHIVAPAVDIQTLDYTTNDTTSARSGTSFAAPQVSAVAAMMLQVEPELTPAEVKAALLLGANWTGPVPCTSWQYEQNNRRATSNCSHEMQPRNYNDANDAGSLGILNNVGFGVLDAAESLRYVKSLTSYVISDHLDSSDTSKQYRFTVTDTSKPVKVILTWLAHPHGGIAEQVNRANTDVPIADLDLSVRSPGGAVRNAASSHQTTEFAVFNPSRTGTYTVTVSGSGLDSLNKPLQQFALASTNPLTSTPSSTNHPPVAQARTLIVSPGVEQVVRLHATDSDGDAVSFHVSQKPSNGTVTTDEMITKTVSSAVYTSDAGFTGTDVFTVVPHDGKTQGTAAVITLKTESLPAGATSVDHPTSANVRGINALEVSSGFEHTDYSRTFTGKTYAVSALYVGSVNMEGADLTFTTSTGTAHTMAVPEGGVRMIQFQNPVTIRSVTMSADGISEEAARDLTRDRSLLDAIQFWVGEYLYDSNDVSMFVGYVPSSCGSSSSASGSQSACPLQSQYDTTTEPGTAIKDNTRRMDTSSSVSVPMNGTLASISVSVDIEHTYIGDLKVILTSPSGTQTVLHDRSGGRADDIVRTYHSSTHAGLRSLHNTQINGDWTLSVGDYARGDVGTLNSWTLKATYTPAPTPTPTPTPTPPPTSGIVFSDDFESSSFTTKWTESGEGDWTLSTSSAHRVPTAPGHPSTNKVMHVDECVSTCTLTLKNALDLSGYESATLSFLRFVDYRMDSGEYLKVELYDGTSWNQVYRWTHGSGDDNRWHTESYDLSSYLVNGFKVRFVAHVSHHSEDVQIDDVVIRSGTAS